MYKTRITDPELVRKLQNADGEWTVLCDIGKDKVLMFNEEGLLYDAYRNKVAGYKPVKGLQDSVFVVAKNNTIAGIHGLIGVWKVVGIDDSFLILKSQEDPTDVRSFFSSRLRMYKFIPKVNSRTDEDIEGEVIKWN